MSITKSVFGVTKDGKQVDSFLIENNNNMKINLITYGATLQSILVKDKNPLIASLILVDSICSATFACSSAMLFHPSS